jgi:hypothetical protein
MHVRKSAREWMIYRTRFLIRAKQLTQPLVFVDALGREHSGKRGDYLVEWTNGTRSIAPRKLFEDVYVAMGLAGEDGSAPIARARPASVGRRDLSHWHFPAASGSSTLACGKRVS